MSRTDDLGRDDTLRAAWAASEPASRHLDEETWSAFLENRLDPDAHEAALEHV